MKKSKMGKYIVLGALVGGIVSLMDETTRRHTKEKMDKTIYYAKHPKILKQTVEQEVDKWSTIYSNVSEEVQYFTSQFGDLKELTPQVKQMFVDTKEAFVESKDEVQSQLKK